MFGKEKESKEFFEVFKKPQNAEDRCDSKVLQRDQVNPTVLPRPDHRKSENNTVPGTHVNENRETERLGWIRDSRKEGEVPAETIKTRRPSRNEIVIKQETLIFGALGAVFLSLACFFVGYKIGVNNVLNPVALEKSVEYEYPASEAGVKSIPEGKKINVVNLSTKKPPMVTDEMAGNIKWTLQIISYSDTKLHIKKARDLAKAIKNMTNYNTFVAKRGKEIVVCVGRFNSKDSNELTTALNEISKLEYEGRKQFASSYPIQVR
ncbi:MAG: hypothetical protein K8F52_11855 [Candidatus Scalindua rubra]|uniref:Uncharacterized protein n=1 Tax=Candidatus Scalindua brodae TaxID=237368 RepID=A0A0B0ER99_9BACT|nr:MAG: hypothetical protein SCABRO_01043 [Candidatus Scalindua brodae]MBZ0109351.1 hypothetical protein [Candidatus Scalindua rubra]TWU36778.1 hypothetical protein S225a_02680 [Candidatus Brocadiaceae bacterium S225]